jgi:3-oxoacyl-[acyl-carrier-protein] synthase-3
MSFLTASAFVPGANSVRSEEVDREFGMPAGKLQKRAGIVSIARATVDETEVTLAAKAVHEALAAVGCGAQELDWIFATSETQQGFPSLGAQLHSRLLAREACGVLDIGGACLGFVNALAAARAFFVAGQAQAILIVTADVHSRTLTPQRVAGEFGGLFGDGASAFLLRSKPDGKCPYQLGEFHFGCAGQYAAAIRVVPADSGALEVQFDGEALSRAAVSRLERVLRDAELRSGFSLSEAAAFATHQPNPRLVTLLARQLGVAPEKFPPVARIYGNLGSTTCAAALHAALAKQASLPPANRKPVFLASLGPGLLFGGGWAAPSR